MPGVGDQHRTGAPVPNPFEEIKPRMSEYTAQEIASLQSKLEKQLGPEFISSRPGAGGQKVYYLAAEKCINLANEVFGFNGWSSEIRNIQIDFVDENTTNGKICLGLSVVVRVTLKDGTFHEDIGYGHMENAKGKAMAFEKAKKEGTTDALKRCLKNFGNVLGNCLYDKDFLARVNKVKVGPTKWNVENLHRASQYAMTKKEELETATVELLKTNGSSEDTSMTEIDDEFGVELFDEAEFSEAYYGEIQQVLTEKETKMGPPVNTTNVINPHLSESRIQQRTGLVQGAGRPMHPAQQHAQQQAPPLQQRQNPTPTTTNEVPGCSNGPTPGAQTPNRPNVQTPQAPLARNASMDNAQKVQSIPQSALPGSRANPPSRPAQPHPPQTPSKTSIPSSSSSPGLTSHHFGANPTNNATNRAAHSSSTLNADLNDNDIPATVSFVSARSARDPTNPANPALAPILNPRVQPFNPHAESPSIRKSTGVDHAKSAPINRAALGAPAQAPLLTNNAPVTSVNFVDPSKDMNRRVGAPPGMTTSFYRPPSMKRNADGTPVAGGVRPVPGAQQGQGPGIQQVGTSAPSNLVATKRPPLIEVTNLGMASPAGGDSKRLRVEEGTNQSTSTTSNPREHGVGAGRGDGQGPVQQQTPKGR